MVAKGPGNIEMVYSQYILCTREITFQSVEGYDKRLDFILIDANGFIDVMERKKHSFFAKLRGKLPQRVLPQIVNPQGILIIGRSNDFNEQQKQDFELIKR